MLIQGCSRPHPQFALRRFHNPQAFAKQRNCDSVHKVQVYHNFSIYKEKRNGDEPKFPSPIDMGLFVGVVQKREGNVNS